MTSVSLYELNEYITRVVALNFQEPVWVSCELSKVSDSRGNYYLDLVEKKEDSEEIKAQSKGILWLKNTYFLKKKLGSLFEDILADGNEVKLKVEVSHHERYGLSLNVLDIDASYTFGQVEMNRQRIIETLREKDLLYKNEQLEMPMVINRIAVISSHTAAGYQDFCQQLQNNNYGYHFHHELFASAMQGMNTEAEVVASLEQIQERKNEFDVIAIIRGGGSKLDLSAFDNFKISENIAKHALPVVVGIGHDIDQTITDLVAHTSLKTPTAVADHFVEHNLHFESELIQLEAAIKDQVLMKIEEDTRFLQEANQYITINVLNDISNRQDQVVQLEDQIDEWLKHYLQKKAERLEQASMIISMNDPINVLKRGFSLTKSEGKIIKNWKGIKKGSIIETHLSDGSKLSEIK